MKVQPCKIFTSILVTIATLIASCEANTTAAKSAAYVAASAAANYGSLTRYTNIGPAHDEIRVGTHKGQKILFFEGSDGEFLSNSQETWDEWLSNVNCAAGGCDTTSVVNQVYNKIPSSWRTSNDVLCVAFSRGNFFGTAFAKDKPSVCKMFVGFGSPGHSKDARSGARVLTIGSASDPVSWLGAPMEKWHWSKTMGWATHSRGSYFNSVKTWIGSSWQQRSNSQLAADINSWKI